MGADWIDDYYGDLYYESVADLLTARLSWFEAKVVRSLLGLHSGSRALDLACGHGRHARALSPEVGALVGLDRSRDYLRRARDAGALLVQGDLRALPFPEGAFDAIWSWYASLFMFDDAENARCLGEAARVLRPGGRLLVHHANPLRLAEEPEALAERDLPGGGRVEERSRFDPATGRDRCARRVVREDGVVLAGVAHLRYYTPDEWEPLARGAGLKLLRVTSTWQAEAPDERFDPEAPDLIALLSKVSP